MAAVRIYSNRRDRGTLEWAGAGTLDLHGQLRPPATIPGSVCAAIEHAIAHGKTEGIVFGAVGLRYKWALDI
jgi:hypothetical protein